MPSKARRKKDDDSSSSSDSDSDCEQTVSNGAEDSKPLSLLDDDVNDVLILPPTEDAGELESVLGEADGYSESVGDLPDISADQKQKSADQENEVKPKKKKKRRKVLFICTANCKYEVIRRVSKKFGFKEVSEDDDWNLYWTDYSVALERVMEMKRYQKINHFPGMSEICRKDLLSRNLNRMSKQFPKEYNVFPKSWVLPADYGDFLSYTRQKKNKTYILKPASGCQGKGIWITKNVKDIKPHEHMVCQQYLSRPFLIDGFKFDFRLYVLVTSCDPLRIFIFKDGLARFATSKYHDPTHNNTENVFMHLTNYAINKTSDQFIRDDEEGGSKRRISTINRWWKENGYDLDKIWGDIDDVVIKTLISISEILTHNYRTCFPNHIRGSACFEILGFDVMFDRKLKPFVVEVNHSPSFHTDATLDKEIKEALIYDTMNLINCGAVDKRKCIEEERKRIKERLFNRGPGKKETKEELEVQQAAYLKTLDKYETEHLGNFRRVYPRPGMEVYEKFFHSSGSLFQETAAYKARSEAARIQREEIRQKQEKLDSILKKKKPDSSARPESPGGMRRRQQQMKRPLLNSRRMAQSQPRYTDMSNTTSASTPILNMTNIDTMRPQDIAEDEELERISGLLQRDNLVRGLGIVEHVYRMLHCTPGTMSSNKPQSKTHARDPAISMLSQFNRRINSVSTFDLTSVSLPNLTFSMEFPSSNNNSNNNNNGKRVSKRISRLQATLRYTSSILELDPSVQQVVQGATSDYGSAQSLISLSNPTSSKHSTFVTTTQRQAKQAFLSPTQNGTNLMQRPMVGGKYSNSRKHGVDVDADRKSLMRNAISDAVSAPPAHYYNPRTLSGGTGTVREVPNLIIPLIKKRGARKAVSITQPSMGGDISSFGLTNHSYQSYVTSKVQPANTQHLSVISAPAPVLQRPDLPPSRKLASLENALRGARHPTRRTVKLKTLESGPNALVYS